MYAVIATGGKQYRVQPGIIVEVEKLEGDVGSSITFDQVLMVSKPGETSQIWLGKPLLNGATVHGEIVAQGRGDKVTIIKMKRRKGYRKTQGHRQNQTQLIITSLDNGSGEKLNLSDSDKKAKLAGFYTDLAPKGLASTPKTLGSRKRMAEVKASAAGVEAAKTTSRTASTKKAAAASSATTEKKAPAKKAAPKAAAK